MSSLCDYLKLVPDYLARNPDNRAKLRADLLGRFRKETWTADLKQMAMRQLQTPPRTWDAHELEEFELAIDTASPAVTAQKGRAQDFTTFPSYIHASLWKEIQECESDFQKAHRVCEHLWKLGLRTISEKMALHVMTFTLVASNQCHDKDTEEDLQLMYKGTKKLLRKVLDSHKGNDEIICWNLPSDPASLNPDVLRLACGEESPISPPPVDPKNMVVYESRFQVRPRKPIEKSIGPVPEASHVSAMQAMQTLSEVAKHALSVVAYQHRSPDTLKLKMLTSPTRGQRGTSKVGMSGPPPQKPLALPYLSRSESAGMNAAPRNLSNTFDEAMDSKQKHVKEDDDLQIEEVHGAKHTHLDDPTDDTVPRQEDPDAMLVAAGGLSAALHTPTRSGGSKAIAKMKKPGSVMDTPSLKRPASVLNVSPTKKPAGNQKQASLVAPQKRPSAKQRHGSGKPVEDLKNDRGRVLISAAKRLELYPRGCSKCRQRAGCTRSCYIGRAEI
eukprot:Skav229201  [mRNA]  locus=scaffold2439:26043:27542:- [translate_table: standard]